MTKMQKARRWLKRHELIPPRIVTFQDIDIKEFDQEELDKIMHHLMVGLKDNKREHLEIYEDGRT